MKEFSVFIGKTFKEIVNPKFDFFFVFNKQISALSGWRETRNHSDERILDIKS